MFISFVLIIFEFLCYFPIGLLNDIQVRARKFSKPKTIAGVVSTASNQQLSPVECSVVAEFCVHTSSERVKTPLELLDDDHRQLLVLIVNFQEQFELPKNEDITRVNVSKCPSQEKCNPTFVA